MKENDIEPMPENDGCDDSLATLYRLIALFNQALMVGGTAAVLKPTRRELRAALAAGLTTALFDFFIESLAYENDLWYCYGGFQKINIGGREFDMLKVPADMLVGFVFSGMFFALVGDAPRLLRRRNPLLGALLPKRNDRRWKRNFALATSMVGATGDFTSKKLGAWETGPGWTWFHCAFAAWLPLVCLTMFVYDSRI